MTMVDEMFDSYEEYEEYEDEETDLFATVTFVEDDNPNQFVLKVHNLADGANSLGAVADMLRDYANFLESMEEEGFVLSSRVTNGVGFAYKDVEND